jgi:hypothetical protein
MFARFHYSIRPKTIIIILTLTNLGRNAAAFSTKLDNLVLKTNSDSETINKMKTQTKQMLTVIKGDEQSQLFSSTASMHKATQQSTSSNSPSRIGSCFDSTFNLHLSDSQIRKN